MALKFHSWLLIDFFFLKVFLKTYKIVKKILKIVCKIAIKFQTYCNWDLRYAGLIFLGLGTLWWDLASKYAEIFHQKLKKVEKKFREITPTFFWVKILVVIGTPFGLPPNIVQHGSEFLPWFTSFWIWCLGSLLNNCESLVHRLFPKMYKNLVKILFASWYQIGKFSMRSNIAYFVTKMSKYFWQNCVFLVHSV